MDERGRTNVDHAYAIGDCSGKRMLAHAAEAMGIVSAETTASAETQPVGLTMVPRATFSQPQIGSLRLTEEQANARGHQVKKRPFLSPPTENHAGSPRASGS